MNDAYIAPGSLRSVTVDGGNYCGADYKVLFADGHWDYKTVDICRNHVAVS